MENVPWPAPLSGRGFKALHLHRRVWRFSREQCLTLARQFELSARSAVRCRAALILFHTGRRENAAGWHQLPIAALRRRFSFQSDYHEDPHYPRLPRRRNRWTLRIALTSTIATATRLPARSTPFEKASKRLPKRSPGTSRTVSGQPPRPRHDGREARRAGPPRPATRLGARQRRIPERPRRSGCHRRVLNV